MKFLIALAVLACSAAHAATTVSQYGPKEISNISSTYASLGCTEYQVTSPNPGEHFIVNNVPVTLTTTDGEYVMPVSSSTGECYTSNGKGTPYCKKTLKEACDSLEASATEAANNFMGTLFDIKTARVQAAEHYCFVNYIRVFHDGLAVSDSKIIPQVVACP